MGKNTIKVSAKKISIEVDSSNNRIKSQPKTHIDFILPRTEIFDDSFGRSFN